MTFPRVLAAVTREDSSGALALVDLQDETCEVVGPYRIGGFGSDGELTYLGHIDVPLNLTRLEVFDANGLLWMRRIPHCIDTHSLAFTDKQIALASTGTNEVLFLDRQGREQGRWSPDPAAEPDSWHLNTLFAHEGRFFVTCFGNFCRYRDWSTQRENRGLLVEIPSGRVIVSGLTMPHDPVRVEGGWIINDSGKKRTVFCRDGGTPETIVELPHFTRGLVVLPDYLLIGLSVPRCESEQERCAQVAVVERSTRRIVKKVKIPFLEIGHLLLAPSAKRVAALQRDQTVRVFSFCPLQEEYEPSDRIGSLHIVNPETPPFEAERCAIKVELTNHSTKVWSSDNLIPLVVGHEMVDATGRTLFRGAGRTRLPWALGPGKTLTFPLQIDLTAVKANPMVTALRLTLVQGVNEWWQPTEQWSPGSLPLTGSGVPEGDLAGQNRQLLTLAARAQGELRTLRVQYDTALRNLAAERMKTADLGPRALAVARGLQRLARKFPLLSLPGKWALDLVRRIIPKKPAQRPSSDPVRNSGRRSAA